MSHDSIARVRRFNRAVTTETGVLDTSFLGRGRPLGVARVLNAIGHGMTDVADIREYLGLDSGLTSRLLRTLETEGLVTTRPSENDARKRVASLTPEGEMEYAAYEALSDEQARRILARHPDPEAILDAMDLIASALGRDRIALAMRDPDCEDALYCFNQYFAELGRRFEEGYDAVKAGPPDADQMRPPKGAFFIAYSDGLPVGCVILKGYGHDWAEIKRLWVADSARGLGLARRLMGAAEDAARDLGIDTLRLDTNHRLPEAMALYRKTGWYEIPRFNDDPYPDHFFEKKLG
jgi:DNA-binding MarR family transcriptional regulator/predicted GNAT family acetyltransferase